MSYDKDQLRSYIVKVTTAAGLCSASATEQLMLTGAVETGLGRYLYQKYGGPAKGLFQMEPDTHDWLWDRILYRQPRLINRIEREISPRFDAEEMEGNLEYAIVMARINYLRITAPLPDAGDVEGLAAYWKKYWNTEKGKGTVEQAVEAYKRLCV